MIDRGQRSLLLALTDDTTMRERAFRPSSKSNNFHDFNATITNSQKPAPASALTFVSSHWQLFGAVLFLQFWKVTLYYLMYSTS